MKSNLPFVTDGEPVSNMYRLTEPLQGMFTAILVHFGKNGECFVRGLEHVDPSQQLGRRVLDPSIASPELVQVGAPNCAHCYIPREHVSESQQLGRRVWDPSIASPELVQVGAPNCAHCYIPRLPSSDSSFPCPVHVCEDVGTPQLETLSGQAPWKGYQGIAAADVSKGKTLTLKGKNLTAKLVHKHQITTLMINGLPQSWKVDTVTTVMNEAGFAGYYDVVYVPFTIFGSGEWSSMGYAFVNAVSVQAAADLVQAMRNGVFKTVDGDAEEVHGPVVAADIQGFEALLEHMRRRKIRRIRNPSFKPFILDHSDML